MRGVALFCMGFDDGVSLFMFFYNSNMRDDYSALFPSLKMIIFVLVFSVIRSIPYRLEITRCQNPLFYFFY